MLSRRAWLQGLAAGGLSLAAGGGARAQGAAVKPVTFLTNYALFGRHAPFYIGVEKGFYREAGFDLKIQPTTGSGFVNTAIDAGKADYAITDASLLVQSIAKGAKVRGFGVFMDISANGVASTSPLPTPESLIGKTIAAAVTDSSRVVIPIIYSQHNLDASKLQWVAADPGTYFSLLLGGRVDVIAAAMDADRPALGKAAAAAGKQVQFAAFGNWGYDVFGLFLVTSPDRIAQSPAEVKAFAAATVKSVKYAMANPEEAAKSMAAQNPAMDPDLILAQWRAASDVMQTAYVKQHGYGAATQDRLQHTIDLARTALKIEATVTPDQLYAPGLMPS
jgi:NitT/TauT family transport system substrate-binding protein